jgi:hypothetical protein
MRDSGWLRTFHPNNAKPRKIPGRAIRKNAENVAITPNAGDNRNEKTSAEIATAINKMQGVAVPRAMRRPTAELREEAISISVLTRSEFRLRARHLRSSPKPALLTQEHWNVLLTVAYPS